MRFKVIIARTLTQVQDFEIEMPTGTGVYSDALYDAAYELAANNHWSSYGAAEYHVEYAEIIKE